MHSCLPRKAREKMLDSPHAVGNGFTCPEKRSAKLTSVLEAVAGEYALVINGHSLVSVFTETPSLHVAGLSCLVLPPLTSAQLRLSGPGRRDSWVRPGGDGALRFCVPGPRAGGGHGAGVPGDGLCLQSCHLLPGDPFAEGPGGGAG